MNSADSRPVSSPAIVGIFAAAFLVLAILLNILVIFVPFDNPAMGFLVVVAAAGVAGQYWFSREKVVPAGGRTWNVALLCGIVSAVLSAGFAVFGLSGDQQMWNEFSQAGIAVIAGVFAAILVIQVLLVRVGFWLTFRQAAKKPAA